MTREELCKDMDEKRTHRDKVRATFKAVAELGWRISNVWPLIEAERNYERARDAYTAKWPKFV